jgi:hypothetical protein
MMRDMFKVMVCGISNKILKTVQNLQSEQSGALLFSKLKNEMYDDQEERMSLWLPLSLKDKLNMIMHQRNPEEAEIMLMLLD